MSPIRMWSDLRTRRTLSVAKRGRKIARRPMREELEPRCLLAALSVTQAVGKSFSSVEGRGFTATVASFSSSDSKAPSSAFRVTIDWGDGSTGAGKVVKGHGHFTAKGKHTYKDELDTHQVTTIITPAGGGASAQVSSNEKNTHADFHVVPVELTMVAGTTYTNLIVGKFQILNKKLHSSDFNAQVLFPFEQNARGIPATIQPDASLKNSFNVVVPSYRPLQHNNPNGDTNGNFSQVEVFDKSGLGTAPGFVTQNHTMISHAPLNIQPTPAIYQFLNTLNTNSLTLARFTDLEGLEGVGRPGSGDANTGGFSATLNWGGAARDETLTDLNFEVQPGQNGADPLVTVFNTAGGSFFGKLGTFTVTVKISYQDPEGGPVVTATSTTTLTVAQPVSIQLHGLPDATVGVPIGSTDLIAGTMGDALFAYVDFNDFHTHFSADFRYQIDWGDRTPIDTSARLVGIGGEEAHDFIVYATHTYQKTGDFTVTFRVLTLDGTVIATAAYDGPQNGEINRQEPVWPPA